MLSRIFLRYVDRFGCDYHRLSATDLQMLIYYYRFDRWNLSI